MLRKNQRRYKIETTVENLQIKTLELKNNVEDLGKKLEEFIAAENINKTVTDEQPLESTVLEVDMSFQTFIRVNRGFKCIFVKQ